MHKRFQSRNFFKTHTAALAAVVVMLCAIFSSCSNNIVQTTDAKLSVVFDYDSYEELPKARLSVFVEAESNPNRLETITVTCKECEYVWESDDLVLAQNNEVKYCGLTNIVMPADEKIPKGEYTVTYLAADNEKKEMKAVLNYDQSFYETKAENVGVLMNKYLGSRMLTVFGEENKILYYGPRSSQYSDARGIWNEYRNAQEFQESWVSSSGNVVCNLPVEKVVPGN